MVIINISAFSFGQHDVRSDLVHLCILFIRFGIAGIENDIRHAVTGKIVFTCTGEIHTGNGLIHAGACFPAHQVIETESLLSEFNGTFPTDFENHSLIASGHVGISIFS